MRKRLLFWILVPFAFAYGAALPVRAWIRSRRDRISFADALQRMASEAEHAAAQEGMFLLPDGRMVDARVIHELPAEPGLGPLWELRLDGDQPIAGRPLNSTLAELLGYDVGQARWPSWIDDFAARIEATKS